MDQWDAIAVKAIQRQGQTITYSVETEGSYDVETGTTTNSSSTYTTKAYMKPVVTNQFNYPNLIGKEVVMFYLSAYGLTFIPNVNDSVTIEGKKYTVNSIMQHTAAGKVVLYKLLCSK